jgi:hypothetical protein
MLFFLLILVVVIFIVQPRLDGGWANPLIIILIVFLVLALAGGLYWPGYWGWPVYR